MKPDDFGQPAIHLASKYDHQDVVDILLKVVLFDLLYIIDINMDLNIKFHKSLNILL